MARGGRRSGNKGTAYPNRSDLRTPPAPRGLPYGERQQLIAAQRQVPMGPPPAPGAAAGGGGGGPQQAAPPSPPPGQIVPGGLTGPTARPNEPVTAGLPIGPGPGPEVLSNAAPNRSDPLTTAAAALNALGDKADLETRTLRAAINATLANQTAP